MNAKTFYNPTRFPQRSEAPDEAKLKGLEEARQDALEVAQEEDAPPHQSR